MIDSENKVDYFIYDTISLVGQGSITMESQVIIVRAGVISVLRSFYILLFAKVSITC